MPNKKSRRYYLVIFILYFGSIAAALYAWHALNIGVYTIPAKSGREGITIIQSENPYIFLFLIATTTAWATAVFIVATRKTISLKNRHKGIEEEINAYIENINSRAPSELKPLGYGLAALVLILILSP